jgi:hypothetical protein
MHMHSAIRAIECWVSGVLTLGILVGSPPRAGADDLRVIDSRGIQVGTLVSLAGGFAEVLIPTPDSAVVLRLGRGGFLGAEPQLTRFATDDCTGAPRLLDPGALPALFQPIATIGGLTPQGTLVIPTPDAPALTTVESVWKPGDQPPCDGSDSESDMTRATTVLADLAGLVPPFSLSGRAAAEAPGLAVRTPPGIGVAVDGAGQVLGPLASASVPPIGAAVLFEAEGRRTAVGMTAAGALLGNAFVSYAANNCTGTPFLVPLSPTTLLVAGIDATGALLRDDGPAAPLVLGSEWNPFAGPPCVVIAAGPPQPVRAAVLLEDLAARPLPFGIRVQEGGPSTPSAARPPVRKLLVEDALGASIGLAFLPGELNVTNPVVLIRSGHRLGEVSLEGVRFGGGTVVARFDAVGCAGPVLVAEVPGNPVPLYPPTAIGPGQVLHTADGPGDTVDLQFRWDHSTATCVADALGPTSIRRTSALADLSTYTLPLRAR